MRLLLDRRWALPAALLLALGCQPEPIDSILQDAAPDARAPFADAAPLRDGTVIRRDAALPPPRDADVITEAGVCRTGSASGTACTPAGAGIPGALIAADTRDCSGRPQLVTTQADFAGRFRLSGLAPGPTSISLRAGNFFGRFDVEIVADADVPVGGGVSNKVCLESNAARLAVLTGDYDQIQQILDDIGFGYDLYCGDSDNHRSGRALLADRDALSRYDILFINCRTGIDLTATNPEVQAALETLRWYVRQGGSVYVSDLSASVIARAWPDLVQFAGALRAPGPVPECCVCTECSADCVDDPPTPPRDHSGLCPEPNALPTMCRGVGGGITGHGAAGDLPADIDSPLLREALGRDTLPIRFNAGGWVEIEAIDPAVEVLVSHQGDPLMILFEPEPGGGRVAYTGFHNHAQATQAMRDILSALVLRL